MNTQKNYLAETAAPAPTPSLENELAMLYAGIMNLGGQIDALDGALAAVSFQPTPEDAPPGLRGVETLPPALDQLRGMLTSVEIYTRRLSNMRNRLAL